MQKCTLALGCFWKPEENFKNKPGILETEVGYAGGSSSQTTYEEVCAGDTGHAEVVRLTFDENIISFKKILDLFFKMHDPTQKDMQYPDVGTQYRSAIYYIGDSQESSAKKAMEKARKLYKDPITTEVKELDAFYVAEGYHQDYYENNPNAPYCAFVIAPKIKKLKKKGLWDD